MLSLIRPSASICSHETNEPSILLLETSSDSSSSSSSNSASASTSSTASLPNPTSLRQRQHSLHFKPSLATRSSSSPASASYKDLVAQFTATAPRPYGVIPPRRKKVAPASSSSSHASTGRVRSSSTSLPVSATGASCTSSLKKKPIASTPSTPRTSIELHTTPSLLDSHHCNNSRAHTQLIHPLFHSLQSFLPEPSTSSSTRLGFWANLKAHCLAATATSFTWPSNAIPGTVSDAESIGMAAPQKGASFSPTTVLLGPTGASVPTVGVDATPRSASLTEALLSLPNLAPSPMASRQGAYAYQQQSSSTTYPVSVAAMDRFKPIRSDTIPLKTFTYHETPVVDRPRSVPLRISLPKTGPRQVAKKNVSDMSNAKGDNNKYKEAAVLPPLLPRHLRARETRSNTDYLRMMAAELRMIRSRKLISPLKPRGYLPRRKEAFRTVKSSLRNSFQPPSEEDDHPLNNLLVGSWSSVSSADSFLSDGSSGYQTACESFQ
ncbi:hypothetical protein BG004_008154 [Podila humilis]|nr:hypothetical protein BG004_008154 [Podila humilis]